MFMSRTDSVGTAGMYGVYALYLQNRGINVINFKSANTVNIRCKQ